MTKISVWNTKIYKEFFGSKINIPPSPSKNFENSSICVAPGFPYFNYTHRVKYHNLKRERSLNALSLEELSSLWIPPLVFENTADNEAVEGTKDSEVCSSQLSPLFKDFCQHVWMIFILTIQVTLTREGDFIRSSPEEADEVSIQLSEIFFWKYFR